MARAGRKRKQKPIMLGHVAIVEVDNPLYSRDHHEGRTNPKKIAAQFNMRENYAGFLWARGHIDDAHYKAAKRVRAAYERMGGAGARAIDYSREHVDGGSIAQTVTDEHLQAAAHLREAFRTLGPEGYHLVVGFCGEGLWPREFTMNNPAPKPAARLRDCLTALAELWGWKTRAVRSFRVAS